MDFDIWKCSYKFIIIKNNLVGKLIILLKLRDLINVLVKLEKFKYKGDVKNEI